MIVYADSSCVVKAYVEEAESEEVRRLLAMPNRVATSLVCYTEVRAALARAERQRRLAPGAFNEAKITFEHDWRVFDKSGVDVALVRFAGDLTEQHGLRGFDAIHLASALTLQRELGEPVFFSAFDDRLVEAALDSGLSQP